MKILALEEEMPEASGSAASDRLLKEEAERVWELFRAGVIRQAHFRKDVRRAVLELECADAEEAERILSGLPLVREGRIRFQVIPLAPYDGFERLFR
ncbi:MAG: muconolactone Delta-isomerase family protein [bacterium]|nr:muconolactone Delta-isomerase family protein [bacterium]